MKSIEVKVLNPEAVSDSIQMMACAARLTQHGEKVKSLAEFEALYDKPVSGKLVQNFCSLPHPTIQKFGLINVVVIGASRRFLAQITRHQNEVKFMSASLQYSDYSGAADFVIPYDITYNEAAQNAYVDSCQASLARYEEMICNGVDHDAAAYTLPQGLRNVLIMSATPYQWKHMIGQRVCRRNTDETRFVMLKIWAQLYDLSPDLFAPETTGPFCQRGVCQEGRMCCGHLMHVLDDPHKLLAFDFPKLINKEFCHEN